MSIAQKRSTGIFFFFLLCATASAQQVRVNVYDKFLKQHRIELEPLPVVASGGNKLALAFSSLSSNFYLQLNGSGWGASTIDKGDKLILLFANDSTVTATSTALQGFAPGAKENTYKHQYAVSVADLKILSQQELVGMRKYSFQEFSDMSIPRQSVPQIRKTAGVFLTELRKANLVPQREATAAFLLGL